MKATIVIEDDHGRTYRAEVVLVPEGAAPTAKHPPVPEAPEALHRHIDYSLAPRPFMKRYGAGLSGPKRFALLVAHFAKGKPEEAVTMKEIERAWSKMTSLIGAFNRAHSIRAKDEGWVDSPEYGMYSLRNSWTEIFEQ